MYTLRCPPCGQPLQRAGAYLRCWRRERRAPLCYPPRLSPRFFCACRLSTGSARIGFIGLGNMGGAMAANILKAHGSAIVYDVRANLCVCVCVRARAASLGAREATPMAHLWLDRDIHLDHCRALAPDCAPLVPPLEARRHGRLSAVCKCTSVGTPACLTRHAWSGARTGECLRRSGSRRKGRSGGCVACTGCAAGHHHRHHAAVAQDCL